jgi:exodeoxyribonuclease V alpha subunit
MQLNITFSSIIFSNSDNGYTVFRFSIEKEVILKIGVGYLPELHQGDKLKVEGEWIKHPKFGEQLQIKNFEVIPPDSKEGLIKFLGSGQIKGISLGLASRIVDHFGMKTLEILDDDPSRIYEVKGFGKKNGESFVNSWHDQRQLLKFLQWVQPFGLPQSTSIKWFRQFGTRSQEALEENPYLLTQDPYRQVFAKVDELALSIGYPPDAYHRYLGAMIYVLKNATFDGHTFLPIKMLLDKTKQLLKLYSNGEDWLTVHIERAFELEELAKLEDKVALPWLAKAEREVADWVISRKDKLKSVFKFDPQKLLKEFQEDKSFAFSETQTEAILKGFDHNFFLITGGPGTGKTTILQGILHLARGADFKILLAAPTGRAAKRMSEVTGHEAKTLHRLLSWQQGEDTLRDADNEVDGDLLIVDEVSMVDTQLLHALIKSIPSKTRVILVGDVDQLPSVGPGQVFKELLEHLPEQQVKLDRVFRQADANDIPLYAAEINQGVMPEFKAKTHFHIRQYNHTDEAIEKIIQLVSKDLPSHFNIDPLNEVQVLSPMNKGPLGTIELNQRLRDSLNPHGSAFKAGGREFRLGDKVMQLKNNYEKMVFNGDVGTILSVNREASTVKIEFDQILEFEFIELDQIGLAYASTIHKSQGNEYPFVVLVLDPSHRMMLQRNLLYTAVTRARDRVFLISSLGVINTCVQRADTKNRFTLLGDYLGVKNQFLSYLDEA